MATPQFKVLVLLPLFSSLLLIMCMEVTLNYFIFPTGFKALYTGLSNERSRNALNACQHYNYSCHMLLSGNGILYIYSMSLHWIWDQVRSTLFTQGGHNQHLAGNNRVLHERDGGCKKPQDSWPVRFCSYLGVWWFAQNDGHISKTSMKPFMAATPQDEQLFVSSNRMLLTPLQVSTSVSWTFQREGIVTEGRISATIILAYMSTWQMERIILLP